MSYRPRSALTISTGAIRRNCIAISNKIGTGTDIIFVAKSNAMGFGLLESVRAAVASGVKKIAVTDSSEVAVLRKKGITSSILLLYHPFADEVEFAVQQNVTLSISDPGIFPLLERVGRKLQRSVYIDLFIDTGMNRYGITTDTLGTLMHSLEQSRHIRIHGISSHFATSDSDLAYAQIQLNRFTEALTMLHAVARNSLREIHFANSAALELIPFSWKNPLFSRLFPLARTSVRIFRAAVGASPVELSIPLEPAFLSFTSAVHSIQHVKKGEYIGYDKTYRANTAMDIATIPVGWANAGYILRKAQIVCRGVRCPMIGIPSANALSFENRCKAGEGDPVYLVKQDGVGEQITLQELAEMNGITQTHITAALGGYNQHFYQE